MQKRPLADITNVQRLNLSTPPRRSFSSPASSSSSLPPSSPLGGLRLLHAPLSVEERYAAIILSLDKQPKDVVAAKVGCSVKAVEKWVKKGHVEDEERSGRPRFMSNGALEAIAYYAKEAPLEATPRELSAILDFECSHRTVRRALDGIGLYGRVARVTPPLNEIHRLKRLSFCNGYGNWTDAQWDLVLWSDEASVQMGPHGQVWVQRPSGFEWDPRFTVHQQKHPPKVHIWGCMTAAGVGQCHIFRENLEKTLMKKILKDNLLQSAEKFFTLGVDRWYFQQDNDPKHKSHLVQNWLHTAGVTDVLDWPPYSPDLNPIEHVWHDVKRRVAKRNPKSQEQLEKILLEEWNSTTREFTRHLVRSMQRRMAIVRQHSGWMSGY